MRAPAHPGYLGLKGHKTVVVETVDTLQCNCPSMHKCSLNKQQFHCFNANCDLFGFTFSDLRFVFVLN